MSLDKIKNLIAEGKTQQALDAFQKLLADKDPQLLNQTYLLENQFNDLQKRMQLGLQDTVSEINRINYTLLNLCDDAEKIEGLGDNSKLDISIEGDDLGGLSKRTLMIFGFIVLVVLAIVFGLVYSVGKTEKKNQLEPQLDVAQEVVEPAEITWNSIPSSIILREKYYGDFQIDIIQAQTIVKDANSKTLNISLKLNCTRTNTGKCLANYLEYRLLIDGIGIAPIDDRAIAELPKEGAEVPFKIAFDFGKPVKKVELEIYYKGKKEKTLSKLKLEASR